MARLFALTIVLHSHTSSARDSHPRFAWADSLSASQVPAQGAQHTLEDLRVVVVKSVSTLWAVADLGLPDAFRLPPTG